MLIYRHLTRNQAAHISELVTRRSNLHDSSISDSSAGTEKNQSTQFLRVAECLYRNSSTGIYSGLVKRSGKQIRKSLKTQDRKLAERRLSHKDGGLLVAKTYGHLRDAHSFEMAKLMK